MSKTHPYSHSEIDKLGNAIVYLTEKINPLSKTKLLKLIYLIEEYSVRKLGLPFFNLDFTVWKLGPVSRDIFVDLSSDEPVLLPHYIQKVVAGDGNIYVKAKVQFSDDEFSDHEMDLLEYVTSTFKDCTAAQLVDITHRKQSLWYLTAQESGVLEYLEAGSLNSTDIEIDFSRLLDEMPLKKAIYKDQQRYLHQNRYLKV